jgi:S1-C subfamily serine protease
MPNLTLALWLALSAASAAPPPKAVAEAIEAESSPTWERTLERVVPAVVALRVTGTRDFDTEDAGSSVGTGFIVDKERGIILTNRHMVHAGPVKAEAVFLDHEEVELEPIYRDPVHDFGFYRFDPTKVRYQDLVELQLVPEAARVGMEIRVIGNDAGEKISILDGTLARLDRNAPDYGSDSYNDFNTFYLQAASNTSGGSSGSPVVDIRGRVVALNAGGSTQAASSFYLPLDRVVVALEAIRAGQPVPRGTLETVFEYTPYDELRRLGLRPETEAAARAAGAQGTGMLVVTETIANSAAWDALQSGDVLVKADGTLVTGFAKLEALLDAKVGQNVALEVERGGTPIVLDLPVSDLHALTPASYLEIGRSVLHDTSLMQARNYGVPPKGVYVAVPGYWLNKAGVAEGSIVTEVDGVAVADLAAFQAEIEKKGHGQRVRLRYHAISDPRLDQIAVAEVDRLWYPMRRCTRDDARGDWPCTDSPTPPALAAVAPQTASLDVIGSRVAKALAPSLVMIDFDVPHPTAGLKDFDYQGAGLVVDAEKGLVIVDRDTVPVTLGDLVLTFGGSVRVPGQVVYLHPVHNVAVVRYDPALLGDTPVETVRFSPKEARKGQKVWVIGLDGDHQVVATDTEIESIDALRFGISGTPRHRDYNVEGIDVRQALPTLGGAITDDKGRVIAQWASFIDQSSGNRAFYGLPVAYLSPVLDALRAGEQPVYRALGAELLPIPLADARDQGLGDARAEDLRSHDPERRKVLQVVRVAGATPAETVLREGDLLLAVDGAAVTRLSEIEQLRDRESVALTVLRDGKELDVSLQTVALDGNGVDHVLTWAGLVLHAPHAEVAEQQGITPEGVYIAWMWYGSPGARFGIRPTRRIVEVDGVATPDLAAFQKAVAARKDGDPVRLKMVGLDGKVQVATLKLDLHYWPTVEIQRVGGSWQRRVLDSSVAAAP